ncbi:myb X, partial [Paramuricea clavata]
MRNEPMNNVTIDLQYTDLRLTTFILMAVGKGFLDQYSVFCVFGSVVGCVVVPLITQSIESVIFSAIVISLTATHLSKRAVSTDSSNKLHSQAYIKEASLRKTKDGNSSKKKSPKKAVAQGEIQVRTSDYRQRKEEKIKRIEEARKLEE